jgi:hypothetical protein
LNDPLDTAMPTRLPTVRAGQTVLNSSLRALTLALKDEKIPMAEIRLAPPIPPFDYFSEITVGDRSNANGEPRFAGTVTNAELIDGQLIVRATSMSEFSEFSVAPWSTSRVGWLDLIYLLARTSGFTNDRIQIHLAEQLPLETFEVAMPVKGCRIERAVDLGAGVRLVPSHVLKFERFEGNTTITELREPFERSEAIAVTKVAQVRRLYEAEEAGVTRIQDAIAWLTVRLRVGASESQPGEVRGFTRSDARAEIRLANVVFVGGVLSGRSWVRDRSVPLVPVSFDARGMNALPGAQRGHGARARQAILALARAADETLGILERVNALWESLEFYAAKTELPPFFAKAERRALRKRATEGLNERQIERLDALIGQLNSAPLMARVWAQAEIDGVWVSASDRDAIADLRRVRNDVVHGRQISTPLRSQLEYGVSIVARLLMLSANGADLESATW